MNTMNIETMKKTVELFDSLPNFKNFAYSREGIKDITCDYNGEIEEITFSCGYLKRIPARVYRDEPAAPVESTWVLGYDDHISAVFVEVK
jgi:hypothetical protein